MHQHSLPHVIVYTDGACRPNPGPGGWAAILRSGKLERVLTGSAENTTSNRMELQAAISALKELKLRCRVDMYVDSQYLQRGITVWLSRWKSRGWHTSTGECVKNADLWQTLEQLIHCHAVHWHWIKGHSGDPDNERANQLARKALDAGASAGE